MSALNDALQQVGVDLGVDPAANNLAGAIFEFNTQNLSPSDLRVAAQGMSAVLAAQAAIGGPVPSVVSGGTGGEWESVHYADDLNAHHPKFKFLFKVGFYGFGARDFHYYVHRCDKPKVKFNHTDVNYYNFRTRVLTSTSFDLLTFTFLDEIGNSVHEFFASYLKKRSKQGDGKANIDGGYNYSSSLPYDNGFSKGQKVIIEQIFANGAQSNRFTLINPRVESFDFDELSMEQNAGNMLNVTISYDAITCQTVGYSTIHSWGQTDLLKGGGTSGGSNGGQSSIHEGGGVGVSSANGGGIGGARNTNASQTDLSYEDGQIGYNSLSTLPGALADLVIPNLLSAGVGSFNQAGVVSSGGDVLSNAIQGTLTSITNGDNLRFGGGEETPDFSK